MSPPALAPTPEPRVEQISAEGNRPSTPRRIQRQRTRGWRMPEGAVYVGRPTKFGNPFAPTVISGWATMGREYAVADYEGWLLHPHGTCRSSGPDGGLICWCLNHGDRDAVLAAIDDLRGLDLACWCPLDQPCHADVLLTLANGPRA